MQLDHQFTVPAPVEDAWKVLLDVPRIAPCMPGATLDEFDGETFTGSVKVKLGPITLVYKGQGRFVETDEAAHRLVMAASGKEARGSGTAAATITSSLVGDGDSTRVDVTTELRITGRPAQFGRGMVNDVGAKLLGQFASCLAETIGGSPGQETSTTISDDSGGGPERSAAVTTSVDTAPSAARPSSGTTGLPESPLSGWTTGTPEAEVEPVDLLEVSGAQPVVRRYAPVAAVAGALAVAAWLVVRRRR